MADAPETLLEQTLIETMVAVSGLCLTLPAAGGDVNILTDVAFSVARGEIVAITGPSGSGKTSLLMLLAGLERASSGCIEIDGREITALGPDAMTRFRRDHIGIVFQAFHLIPGMTALENVMVPLELAARRDAEPRARAALAAVGLSHRINHLPGAMSGGEQQRVALARAIAPEPALVLADEPTGNLDRRAGGMVMDLLFHLQRTRASTLLLVTHDPNLAARCDRSLTIEDGRLAPRVPARVSR